MQKCCGQILFTSKSVGKTWRLKTPAKMCCTFLGKSAGEAGRVFHAIYDFTNMDAAVSRIVYYGDQFYVDFCKRLRKKSF